MYSPGTIHHRTAHITCGGKDREWYIYFGQFSIRSLSSDSIFFDQNIDILQKKVGAEVAVVVRCCSRPRLACVYSRCISKNIVPASAEATAISQSQPPMICDYQMCCVWPGSVVQLSNNLRVIRAGFS